MAGKVRHLKEAQWALFGAPGRTKNLRAIIGKAELETQLGPDRRQALARLPDAVAVLQARIAVAEREANIGNPVAARYPMTADKIAIANYRSLIAFDLEIREHDPRFANFE